MNYFEGYITERYLPSSQNLTDLLYSGQANCVNNKSFHTPSVRMGWQVHAFQRLEKVWRKHKFHLMIWIYKEFIRESHENFLMYW